MRLRFKVLAGLCVAAMVAALCTLVAFTPRALAATLTQVTNFGSNPGGMQMYIYVPNNHPANPAILLAMHQCGSSGPNFYSSTQFASLADEYGFIVIYRPPSSLPGSAIASTPGRPRPRSAAAAATRSRSIR